MILLPSKAFNNSVAPSDSLFMVLPFRDWVVRWQSKNINRNDFFVPTKKHRSFTLTAVR